MAMAMDSELLDDIIMRLLEVRGRPGKQVQLSEAEIRQLCIAAMEIFIQQPILLELEAPIKICGDIHSQYSELLRLFEHVGFPPQQNYLFLGNYVSRGKQGLETICLLLAYKIKYPENFFLLRGNHECASMCRVYGFYDECKRRFNVRLWKVFISCFDCLPMAALIDEKILCMHGGLSPDLNSLDQIRNIARPTDVPDSGLLCDLLWSDFGRDVQVWGLNDSGVSYTFGSDRVFEFCLKHDLDLICCGAHEILDDDIPNPYNGYEFFAARQLVKIFSTPNFCGENDNEGAVFSVDETLMCSFQILQPEKKVKFNLSSATTAIMGTPPPGDMALNVTTFTKTGPAGSVRGQSWTLGPFDSTFRLLKIKVWHDDVIHGIRFKYAYNGEEEWGNVHGVIKGRCDKIVLDHQHYLVKIQVSTRDNPMALSSLLFVDEADSYFGPYGEVTETKYTIPVQ